MVDRRLFMVLKSPPSIHVFCCLSSRDSHGDGDSDGKGAFALQAAPQAFQFGRLHFQPPTDEQLTAGDSPAMDNIHLSSDGVLVSPVPGQV